ncbi:conserved exported hypothetical protein [metagenome]|uniref:Terpene cyclase/mutase family protein n=1 Tax=metagenome TaxID=256318 RepID=A0A2P2C3A9_9ZZZZ
MKRLLRSAAVVSATALTLTTLASGAFAASDPKPVAASSTWLAGQAPGGIVYNAQYDFNDYGLSIDAALAFDAAGTRPKKIAQISDAIAAHVESYTTGVDFGSTDVYAGAVAKAAVMAQTAGDDATSYGGVDLVTRLEGLVSSTAPIAGRIEDSFTPGPFAGDFANVIGQAFASEALAAAGSTEAAAVTDFLLQQQCTEGYFRVSFTADKSAPDQSCDGGTDNSDTDATALVVLALLDQASDPDVATALDDAVAWLAAQQAPDGSFTSGDPLTPDKNTNSTGLAGWALGESGHPTEAAEAATWVRKNMAADRGPCTTELTSERGALAYNGPALKAGRADGITVALSDQWRRATAQALPVLQWAPAADAALALSGPTGFVRAKSGHTLKVDGLAPSERGCLFGGGTEKVLRGTGARLTAEVTVPAGTADRVYAVSGFEGIERATLKVLGSLEVPFTLADRTLAKGALQTVRVRGLHAGEKVTVRWRGDIVATGTAGAAGRFEDTFRVGRVSGVGKVRVTGQFADLRTQTKSFRVR